MKELKFFWQAKIDEAKEQNHDKSNLEVLKLFAQSWRQIKNFVHTDKTFMFETSSTIYKVDIESLTIKQ